ncbi:MAG: Eco57I restriction-modification methylase domain-containing protein [Petrotogales bacterium]
MTPNTTDNNKAKRLERRKQTAEDFTPSWLVKQMLDKLYEYGTNTWKDPRKTFIDPACGNGNFLVEIVKRKLKSGHKALDVAKTVFGLDIMQDNIQEARYRVCRVFDIFDVLDENVVLLVWQNIRRVNDTLGVDFTKSVFKFKKAEKAKLNAIVRKVHAMNKDHKKVEVRRRFLKNYFYNNEHIKALQNVHTPFSLTKAMVKKLKGYTGLTDGKKYLCFNPEFIETLINEGVDTNNIWYISECEEKVSFVGQVYEGVHTIFDDFVSWNHGDKFDVVLGNPPYQDGSGNKGRGHTLWPEFVKCSFDICKDDGYVSLIHPSTWRSGLKTTKSIFEILTNNNTMYLEMHSIDDGIKTFGVTTCYDWYISQKHIYSGNTDIIDETGKEVSIDISLYDIIPSSMIDEITSLFAKENEETIEFIHARSAYGSDKKWVNKTQDDTFKHPVVYSLPKKGKQIWWSSVNDKGHFGIAKVIASNGAGCQLLIDEKGEFGMTEWAWAIADSPGNLSLIKKAMESEKFQELCKYMRKSYDKYNRDFIRRFRKDFWKDFI